MLRRADEGSIEEEREALRRQRAETAAELERLKRALAERVEFVRLRERELEEALGRLGKDGGADRRPLFRLPEARRDNPALDQQRQVLEARTADLVRREAALRSREEALVAREAEVEEAAAKAANRRPPTKTQREKALDEREAQLAEREAALSDDAAQARLQRIEARLAELKEAELAFVKTQAELAARSDRLSEREEEVAARERELGRSNGGASDLADRVSVVDVEAIEARLRRLEAARTARGQSFSAGVRSLQQRGARPRGEPEAPLH